MSKYLETPIGGSGRKTLDERLRSQPQLKARIEQMLSVIENADGDVVKADEAEQRFIEELRKMGQESLQAWAEGRQEQTEQYWNEREGVSRKDKKNSTGTRDSE
jgi:hypothetical protein